MLKKTITYNDFDGNKRTEDFYFNLTQAEIVKMDLAADGGSMEKMLNKIIRTEDIKKIADIVDDFIKKSYGEKSDDGKRFIKSPELSEAFAQTEAYSQLFIELLSEEGANLAKFVNGIIPQDVAAEVAKLNKQ